MTNKDSGGPAFPTMEANYQNENVRGEGMSLRDYFAEKARPQDLNMTLRDGVAIMGRDCPDDVIEKIKWAAELSAIVSGIMADAMLKERNK